MMKYLGLSILLFSTLVFGQSPPRTTSLRNEYADVLAACMLACVNVRTRATSCTDVIGKFC